ncbi:MAG TPA: DUF4097 family beta strand repeat-containing protein [Cyclobacteriaceae bacterium]
MKNLVVILLVLIAAAGARAQEYKVSKSTGRLELHLGRVTVEGHNGNDIIFKLIDNEREKDPRAEGLQSVNSLGLKDNTGLGINVTEKGDIISVYNVKKNNSPDVRILVPKGVIVAFEHEGVNGNGTATFKNMENEIEVSAQYNSVELENVTGPLTIRTIYGHVEVSLGAVIKDPVSIVSVYGYVDVTMPLATKATMKMETSYGEIMVDPAFKFDFSNTDGDRVSGKLNGGGINIDLACNYGKVYLRKK